MAESSSKDNIFLAIFARLPKAWLSGLFGWFASLERPNWLAATSIAVFAWLYKIDLTQAELAIGEYRSLQHFFTRTLKYGARPIADSSLVSPADGRVRDYGSVLTQAASYSIKGLSYSLTNLIDSSWSDKFLQGSYLNIYLSPQDYHHVHMPVDGKILAIKEFPGELWPVTDWSVRTVQDLYAKNSRIAVLIESAGMQWCLVMVAAFNVGDMKLAFDQTAAGELELKRGDLFGTFRLGSSVVLFCQDSRLAEFKLIPDQQIRVNADFN